MATRDQNFMNGIAGVNYLHIIEKEVLGEKKMHGVLFGIHFACKKKPLKGTLMRVFLYLRKA